MSVGSGSHLMKMFSKSLVAGKGGFLNNLNAARTPDLLSQFRGRFSMALG